MLTVIIPVYKVEKTLDRCVLSVINQSYRQLEILLVDDGSHDSCPQMCDKWAEKDGRIRVIHKSNGGLSSARNAALNIANGDLITFVDSDDYIEKGTYSLVLERMTADIDIIEYPIWRFYGSQRQGLLKFDCAEYATADDYWIKGQAYTHSYACNKIYRRSVFNGVRFPEGRVFEDVYTLPLLLANARKVATVDVGLYYYCDNKSGITNTATGNELRILLAAHTDRFKPITDELYYLHVLNIQLDVCSMTDDKPSLNSLRMKNPWLYGLKNGVKLMLLNIVGLKFLCKIYAIKYKAIALIRGMKTLNERQKR